jgi:hypothetical protein
MKKMYFLSCLAISLIIPISVIAQNCTNNSEAVVAVHHIYSTQQPNSLVGHVAHDACYNSTQSRITSWGLENILICGCATEADQMQTIQKKLDISSLIFLKNSPQKYYTPQGGELLQKELTIYRIE